jgi:hypothetical protein
VEGWPSISSVLALDRSDLVNHRLNRISIAGITELSPTPSRKRIAISAFMLLTNPVAAASDPHIIKDQKINFFALLFAA